MRHYTSATETLHAVGAGDRVVAVSHECDYPPEVVGKPRVTKANIAAEAASGEIDQQVRRMVQAGQPLYSIDVELLAKLAPDLIVTQSHCDVCAIDERDVQQAIARHPSLRNARVLALNPTSLNAIFEDIARVGEAVGNEAQARAYLDQLHARVNHVRERVSHVNDGGAGAGPSPVAKGGQRGIGPGATGGASPFSANDRARPRTICIEWIEPLMVAANWMPELIEIAGGRCDLTRAGDRSRYTRWDDVLAFDPEVIVVTPCGFDLPRTLAEMRVLTNLPGWNTLAAVREDRVYAADGNAYFNRSGPRIVDSLEILAELIHPALFAGLNPATKKYTRRYQ